MKNIELMTKIDAVMSNCFHEIEKDVADTLEELMDAVSSEYGYD